MSIFILHRIDAAQDSRMLELISTWGYEGYGWYWRMLELMAGQEDFSIKIDSELFYNNLSDALQADVNKIRGFVLDCLEQFVNDNGEGLFTTDYNSIWSEDLRQRMQKIKIISEARKSYGVMGAQKRWNKKKKKR